MTSACAAGSPRLSQLLAHLRLILVALLLIPCSLLAQTNCTPSPSGLVAWWPGDGFSFDVAGTNHGTLYNGATYAPGKVGTAFSFDGVDDTVWVNPGPSLNFTNAITLEAWINHRRVGSGIQRYLTVVSEIAQIRYDGLASPAGFHFAINVGGAFYDLRPGISPQTNTFYHVVGTYDGTVQRLYINGTLRAIQAVGGALAPATTTGVVLNGGGEAMNGLIDEARIFNRALSAGEVASLYAAGSAGMCFTNDPSPVFAQQPQSQTVIEARTATFSSAAMCTPRPDYQWLFNNNPLASATNATLILTNLALTQAGNYAVMASNMFGYVTSSVAQLTIIEDFNLPGKVAANCTGKPAGLVAWWPGDGFPFDVAGTNHATLSGAGAFAVAKVGQGFNFNGMNTSLEVGDSPTLSPLATVGEMSAELWLRLPAFPIPDPYTGEDQRALLAKGAGSIWEYGFAVKTTGALVLWTSDGSSASWTLGGQLITNQWHHLAITLKRGKFLRIYQDGEMVAESTAFTNSTPDTALPMYVGRRGDGQLLNGQLDEVTLYNRALAGNEIATLYAAGSAGKCYTNDPAPVFVQQPQSQTSYVLASVTFTGAAIGTPRPSNQWLFNGAPLINATNATLVLNNLSTNQAGDYSVIASNMFGSVTSTVAHLSVVLPGFLAGIESFETGWSGWFTDNTSVWEAGVPTSGPNAAHSGNKCLATVLGGN
ncbi:MAG: hypothetical protein NTX27_22360 [Verrucomicrobia bacterium]|nr:hypothetical protein [Verrucomicrobiota bacterium]